VVAGAVRERSAAGVFIQAVCVPCHPGINLLAHPPPFVDSLDCAAAAEGREPIMKVGN
jgi:hypothetical protein